jgi:proteasome lid subunit RPN8/RPN11
MRLLLTRNDLAAIADHARETYPEECCGFLLGTTTDDETRVLALRRAQNERTSERRRRYLIGAESVLAVHREARSGGRSIVGYYHSHPDHPAAPSPFDLEQAWPDAVYLIVTANPDGPAECTAWRLDRDRRTFDSVPLQTIGSDGENG